MKFTYICYQDKVLKMEEKMKKLLCMILALMLCVGVLSACSSSSSDDDTSDEDTTEAAADTSEDEDTASTSDVDLSDCGYYTLVVANSDSSTSMCETYLETLFGQIEEATDGHITFTYQPGGSLLAATEAIDGVKNGLADICWTSTAFYAGQFPIAEFVNLAANGFTSAQMGTDVFEAMIETIPEAAAEFEDWHIIATYACAEAPVCTQGTKIETIEDFQGLQLRAAGTVASNYVTALGATPITMATSDVYEAVEKGTIDGFCNDWHNIDCFNLYECIDYCMTLAINYTACAVLMNIDTYESLDPELQEICDTYFGNYAADMAAYWWDSCRYWVGDLMEENGVEVYEPSDEIAEYATSEEVVGDIHDWYVEYLDGYGYDGQAIYDACVALVEEELESHENDLDEEFNYMDWIDVYGYDADTYVEED